MKKILMRSITLNNGVEMPPIGLGTYSLDGWRLMLLVRKAVQLGYRSFDAASAYGNETWLGRGIRFCGMRRENLFIATKLSNTEQRTGNVRSALKANLTRLGVKYLDLYLMHWPVPDLYLSSWKQMELLYREGLVRAIGVCNFHQHHLNALLNNVAIVPAVNQIERHPLLSQVNLITFCKEKGIQVEAYSPVARMHDRLIKNEILTSIANRHRKTVPQVILRWDLQQGIISVPKTSNPERLKENISIFNFNLPDEDMKQIDKLNINFRVRFDPDNCNFSKL